MISGFRVRRNADITESLLVIEYELSSIAHSYYRRKLTP